MSLDPDGGCWTGAQAMYLKAGYSIQDTDNMLVPLIGIDRRHLMTRTLV